MEVIIDIGNTRTKIGVFINRGIHQVERLDKGIDKIVSFLKELEYEKSIISSTIPLSDADKLALSVSGTPLFLDHYTALPITNTYSTPETLGRDRLAAVVGGQFLYPNQNVLAIDAGTCITYDLIDRDGNYLGGNISPGLELRARAMDEFTGALPLVSDFGPQALLGTTTESAMTSGIVNGFIHEVNGVIESYSLAYPDLKIVLCGGQARYLVNHINYEIFANQNLVLLGLHKILLHNDR